MQAITLEAARYLAVAGAIHGATIKNVHGRKWAITLLGKVDYMLRSERQNPRMFSTLETAINEIHHLGLTRCEVYFELWPGKARHGRALPVSTDTPVDEVQFG